MALRARSNDGRICSVVGTGWIRGRKAEGMPGQRGGTGYARGFPALKGQAKQTEPPSGLKKGCRELVLIPQEDSVRIACRFSGRTDRLACRFSGRNVQPRKRKATLTPPTKKAPSVTELFRALCWARVIRATLCLKRAACSRFRSRCLFWARAVHRGFPLRRGPPIRRAGESAGRSRCRPAGAACLAGQ